MSTRGLAEFKDAEDAFRIWAPAYDNTPNPLLSLEQRCLSPILSNLAHGDVIDMGCGTGRWIAGLVEFGARSVIGIDSSEAMLKVAEAKVHSNTTLLRTACDNTTLPTSSSDLILASFLLSYVDSLRLFAREAARLLRPCGWALLTDVHPDAHTYGWKRTVRLGNQHLELKTNRYELSELHDEMTDSGFRLAYSLDYCFGEEERAIYTHAGRPDLYEKVERLPVIYVAGYRRTDA